MGVAATLLLAANIVYATSYVVTRLVLDDVPPMTLALLRLVLGAAVLVPLARRGATAPIPRGLTSGQGARVFWMGALGFAAAFALSHWGIARSSATNAALLIVVEPLTLVVLGPLLLGERLTRREAAGAALAVAGAVLVVLNGVPGVTPEIPPRPPRRNSSDKHGTPVRDRKSKHLDSNHGPNSHAAFFLKKKKYVDGY